MNPDDRKYIKEHTWAKIEGDIATVGITDHAQKSLTDIVFVELPKKGDEVKQNESLGTIESVKSVSEIISPVTGTVEEVNEEIENDPETINKDPYEKGWMIKIKVSDKEQLNSLMSSSEYEESVKDA